MEYFESRSNAPDRKLQIGLGIQETSGKIGTTLAKQPKL